VIFSLSLTTIESVLSINKKNVKFIKITSNSISILYIIIIFFAVFKAAIYFTLVIDKKTFIYLANYLKINLLAILIRDFIINL
jgi:hypothetical protein